MGLANCSMVLEGGAIKGVFTSGALDFLMEQDFYTKYVVGVSAGACNAVDYVSKQIHRSRDCFIPSRKEDKYIRIGNIVHRKPVYDMDIAFHEFPLKRIPFDFDTFYASDMECEVVVTNCVTGKAEYMKASQDRAAFLNILRASSSMPFLCDLVYINGVPYLDGGMSDSIPVERAIERGYKKHIVILTKNKGYRKKESKFLTSLSNKKYDEYPELKRLIGNRWKYYNQEMALVEKLEKEGTIFVLRPEIKAISRLEQNRKKTMDFYMHGYSLMKERYGELMNYLNS